MRAGRSPIEYSTCLILWFMTMMKLDHSAAIMRSGEYDSASKVGLIGQKIAGTSAAQ